MSAKRLGLLLTLTIIATIVDWVIISNNWVFSVYPYLGWTTIWLLSAEVWGYFTKQLAAAASQEYAEPVIAGLRSARNLSLTALWAVHTVILLVVGIIRRLHPVRLAALGLLAIPIIKVFVWDVWVLERVYRIIVFVGLGVLLISSGLEYQPNGNISGIQTWGILSMLLRLKAATGFPCNPHTFRRTFACLLRKAGLDVMTIKDLGRWDSLEMV